MFFLRRWMRSERWWQGVLLGLVPHVLTFVLLGVGAAFLSTDLFFSLTRLPEGIAMLILPLISLLWLSFTALHNSEPT